MIGYTLAVACLALNIYHEAAFEPTVGMYAVGFVTINRVKARNMDVCDVVFQDHQFSWANHARDRHGKLLPEYQPRDDRFWAKSQRIAQAIMNNERADFTHGATFYYADYIPPPFWARKMQQTGKWGKHIFFKRKVHHAKH